jgi:hypothetical protein
MVTSAVDPKLGSVVANVGEGIDVSQPYAHTSAKHELVGNPAPVIDTVQGCVPAVVACVCRNTLDATDPQTTARRQSLTSPEKVEKHLSLLLRDARSQTNVAFDHPTDRVGPGLDVATAILREVRGPGEKRVEGVTLLPIGS